MSETKVARNAPFKMDVEAGKEYYWCGCGRTATAPFCDGNHAGTGINPTLFVPEKAESVYVCGCGRTARAPLCDGTHSKR
ncbi:MAG: CDGSH iron-sulfur domain-containing protein [Alphaproteobacteria bacterium]